MLENFFPRRKPIEVSEDRKKLLEAAKRLNKTEDGKLVFNEIIKFCKLDSTPEPEFGVLAERNGMKKVANFLKSLLQDNN